MTKSQQKRLRNYENLTTGRKFVRNRKKSRKIEEKNRKNLIKNSRIKGGKSSTNTARKREKNT